MNTFEYIFSELFYVRNHMPVPEVDVKNYELEIEIDGTDKAKTLKLNDICALPKHSVSATIMCGGNRRSEMTQVKPVKGLSWGMAAVGNAVWTGPKLCDILKEMGIESNETQHVHVSAYRFRCRSRYFNKFLHTFFFLVGIV